MNVRGHFSDAASPDARHLEINNAAVMTVATDTGFRTYDLDNGRMICLRELEGSIGFATAVDATNVFGLIPGGPSPQWSPNQFVVWDDQQKKEISRIATGLPPCRACMTETHLALTYTEGIIIYGVKLGKKDLLSASNRVGKYESASNPVGLCCLGQQYAVFPGRTAGQVNVLRLANRTNTIIPAHTSHLQALAVSRDESMLATASSQGTLIRVFSTRDSTKLFEFRRGLDKAIIFSLSFSPSGHQLAVTSDKSTLHIFDLAPVIPPTARTEASTSRVSHSRNSSSSSRPVTIPTRPSVAAAKRASFGAASTSPDNFTNLGTSLGTRQRRYNEVDKFSIAPSDSASQAGVPSSAGGQGKSTQPAWNDMMRQQPQGRALSIMSETTDATATSNATSTGSSTRGKYGNLANLPFAPKILSDTYSTLSCPFEMGDESSNRGSTSLSTTSGLTTGLAALGLRPASSSSAVQTPKTPSPNGRIEKGQIGWLSDNELVVVGAGSDARWEKFRIGFDSNGRRGIERVGWKRYMDDDGLT